MCLAIPGLLEETYVQDGLQMGKVNFGGLRRATCLEYVPAAAPGDYVLVHVGFAISVIDGKEAERSYRILQHTGQWRDLADEPAFNSEKTDEIY